MLFEVSLPAINPFCETHRRKLELRLYINLDVAAGKLPECYYAIDSK